MYPSLNPVSNISLLTKFWLSASLILLASFFLPVSLKAQTEVTGAIEGRVTNSQSPNEPVAGASVQIINLESQVQTATKTGPDGRFVKNQLPPGRYKVVVKAQNFKDYDSENDPQGRTQRVDITLTNKVIPVPISLEPLSMAAATPSPSPTEPSQPGVTPTQPSTPTTQSRTTASTKKTVVDEDVTIANEINTTDARHGGGFRDNEVSTLPLGGTTLVRSFDELALLLPGVALPPQTQGSVAGPGVGAGVGSAGQFAVNGLRSRANNFTIDGSDNNDEDIGVRRQGFLALVPQPIESIQAFRVITLLAPAQYGRNIGAQVDAVSKSGGNETHGTIYGFFNSSQLNARDFFDTANGNASTLLTAGNNQQVLLNGAQIRTTNESGGKDSFTLAQGGIAFGGPLIPVEQNKLGKSLFYFISAEGHILNATKEASFAVPTVEQRGALGSGASGLFVNPLSCRSLFPTPTGCTGTPIDFYFPTSNQADAVFSLFPFPNNPTGVYGRNTLTKALPASGQSKIASGKVDGNFRAFGIQNRFTARYNFTDDFRDIPVTGGAIFSSLRPNVRTQNLSTFLTSEITNSISNELRASYGRTRLNFEELRDPSLLPSDKLPNTPFLLNRPLLSNNTIPNCGGLGCANTGPVPYFRIGTTESGSDGTIEGGALGPLGQLVIAGFSPIGVDVFNFPQRRVNNTYQLADTLTMRAGRRHNLAFGGDFRRLELNSDLPRNSRTLITFNGAPRLLFPDATSPNFRFSGFYGPLDLAAAQAASGTFQTLALPGSSSNIGLRYYQYFFFGQDEWRIRQNLSLSYGVRYEYTTPPREVNNLIERTFNSADVARLLPDLRQYINGRTGIFDPDRNNIAPRIGIAYAPRPSTIIRVGYGWYYDQIIGAVVSQSRNAFPSFLTLNSSGGLGAIRGTQFNVFNFASPNNGICIVVGGSCVPNTFQPYTAAGTLNLLNPNLRLVNGTNPLDIVVDVNQREFPSGFGATLPARNLSTPMAQQYSATVEQRFGQNMALSIAYVGTQGRHLIRFTTPNLGPNRILLPINFDQTSIFPNFSGISLAPGATVNSAGFIVGGRPVPSVGSINIFETSANSRYDALQVQVRGRFAHRMQYQAQYVFSRSIDDVSDVFDLAGAPSLPQNSLTRAGERGFSNFDARHRFSYNFIYDFQKVDDASHNRAYRTFFNGLQIAGTGSFQTGQPFTVNSIFDVNLDGNLTDRLDSTTGLVQTGDRRQPLRLTVDPTTLLAPIGQDGRIGRNTFRAGNILELNLSVIKNFAITETKGIVFRMDIFNFINRANYGIPVRFLEAPGFGQATDTVTPGRRIQFAVKFSF
ncbi:MAG TPA: TonB-dependent receptor [Pyrinomonadaceae bacterium]